MTISALQNWGFKQLQEKVWHPELEVDLLLTHILKKERPYLYAHPEKIISDKKTRLFKNLIKRRQQSEPFAYLVGHKEFCGLEFKVNPQVLIPRFETELLVEQAVKIARRKKAQTIIDIGTGSGAIIISIAEKLKQRSPIIGGQATSLASDSGKQDLRFYGLDISAPALKIARLNAKNILPQTLPIKFLKSDLLSNLEKKYSNLPSPVLIVANLPYLKPTETRKKQLQFEPHLALAGGKAGLELVEKLIQQFKALKNEKDTLLLEIGASQAVGVKKLVKKYLPKSKLKIIKDQAGLDRVVVIE